MIHSYRIDGLPVKTGDILCTTDGRKDSLIGWIWRIFGKMVPGPVDHVAIYLGPGGRCAEAGIRGVITFFAEEETWDGHRMKRRRGYLVDTFYGAAYPLAERGYSTEKQQQIRKGVARYCMAQVKAGKWYNLNLFNPETENYFYCSQLAYRAYLSCGIDLMAGVKPYIGLPGLDRIILPQQIWEGSAHRRSPSCGC